MRIGICLLSVLLVTGCGDDDSDAENQGRSDSGSEIAVDGGGGEDASSGACPEPDSLDEGRHLLTLEHDGTEREYTIIVPEPLEVREPVPLLLNMHGFTSNMNQEVAYMAADSAAEEAGYVVIYPNGLYNSWNAGVCCGQSVEENIDDVSFLRAVVEDVSGKLCIDAKRVYSTGMSNGGFMSYRLACEASDMVAAIAPVAGPHGMGNSCEPERPVPVMHFHGAADTVAQYSLVQPGIDIWRDLNGCQGEAVETYNEGDTVCETWGECDEDVEVTLCTSEGAGHCWPGVPGCPFGEEGSISANQAMVEFFEKYRLP